MNVGLSVANMLLVTMKYTRIMSIIIPNIDVSHEQSQPPLLVLCRHKSFNPLPSNIRTPVHTYQPKATRNTPDRGWRSTLSFSLISTLNLAFPSSVNGSNKPQWYSTCLLVTNVSDRYFYILLQSFRYLNIYVHILIIELITKFYQNALVRMHSY